MRGACVVLRQHALAQALGMQKIFARCIAFGQRQCGNSFVEVICQLTRAHPEAAGLDAGAAELLSLHKGSGI